MLMTSGYYHGLPVTSPHFEKVRGDVGIVGNVLGCGGRCGKRYESVEKCGGSKGRCRER